MKGYQDKKKRTDDFSVVCESIQNSPPATNSQDIVVRFSQSQSDETYIGVVSKYDIGAFKTLACRWNTNGD